MLIGHVSFDTGTGGTDEYTLYEYQLSASTNLVGGTLNQICSTIEVDVAQTNLTVMSLTRQVNVAYDEIRVASTLDEVLGYIAPPVGTTIIVK
jgi:hypothetical protein